MKKIIAVLLCCLFIVTAVYPITWAESYDMENEDFDDGSYLIVTFDRPPSELPPDYDGDTGGELEDLEAEESTGSPLTKIIRWLKDILGRLFAKQKTTTKTKYCNYFDSNGKLLWSVRLKATFTYNYRKAVCVSSDITYETRDSDWKFLSYDSGEVDNSAIGSFSVRQYKLGVPLKLIEKSLTLTCDKNGNVK